MIDLLVCPPGVLAFCRCTKRSSKPSQLCGCQICSHRYEVAYAPKAVGAGLPAPPGRPGPAEPVLNGRNSVLAPRSFVVTNTRSGSTAKLAMARRVKIGSVGSRSERYC